MFCPSCRSIQLVMTERQGIEIDYCPECRGVWLDRGELDKLIERSAAHAGAGGETQRHFQPAAASTAPPPRYQDDDDDDHYRDGGHHRKKKRRGFLGDLLDFD